MACKSDDNLPLKKKALPIEKCNYFCATGSPRMRYGQNNTLICTREAVEVCNGKEYRIKQYSLSKF